MHKLEPITTRNWLRKNALFSNWIQRVADHMQNVFPDDHHTNRGLRWESLPHALALNKRTKYLDLTERIADCLASDGRYQEAEVLYKKLVGVNQEKGGSEHVFTLTSMANLAETYRNQGRWNEAERLNVQVMETWKTVLCADRPDTLSSMNNFAYTWKSQGKLQDTLTLVKKCSDMRRKVLGPSHPGSRSSSCALNNWMDEYNALTDQTPLTREKSSQPQREVSAGSSAAVVTTLSTYEEHINLPYTLRRSAAQLFLGSHPLIIAARTPSPAPEGQNLHDVDYFRTALFLHHSARQEVS
ncbi:kinesin light chain, putative [Talaromyces stipitatus ATCC 10500]|uniref:Kinesin light chain, putative n=1 Tax=Talaromyces stipitatus (strain ATCC 10500 / CBS 375.48 / QM 6759 / NRRL 1006) TaxID=441959 RepID=B8MRV9_TALSN|nr:kinesin light chain, putative [Talaromyces stipitatus ATCC 10500]EED13293.1 kinesin light chain, putative [Talaromyces stipitatus ATCC 10500]